MQRLILQNFQSPGDILMLTAAVRDLHHTFPGEFQTDVRTPCPALWENNPYLTPLDEGDPGVRVVDCEYPLVHESNHAPYHFIHGFRLFLNETLGLDIRPGPSAATSTCATRRRTGCPRWTRSPAHANSRFWFIVSGGKTDFTAKWWDPARSQQVVDHFRGRIRFVQVRGVGRRTTSTRRSPASSTCAAEPTCANWSA